MADASILGNCEQCQESQRPLLGPCNATDRDKGTVLLSVLGSRRALEAVGGEAEWPSGLGLRLSCLQGTQGLGFLLLTAWGLGQQRPLQLWPFWP